MSAFMRLNGYAQRMNAAGPSLKSEPIPILNSEIPELVDTLFGTLRYDKNPTVFVDRATIERDLRSGNGQLFGHPLIILVK